MARVEGRKKFALGVGAQAARHALEANGVASRQMRVGSAQVQPGADPCEVKPRRTMGEMSALLIT
jgi:hypothetical protein